MAAAPERHKVLLETNQVRVLETLSSSPALVGEKNIHVILTELKTE